MEADWSVEIGPGLPLIEICWEGFIDLRGSPDKIDVIVEARGHPAIRSALLSLNEPGSPLFTSKCDCWGMAQDEIDPDEFAAGRESAWAAFASYIDILECDPARFGSFEFHEHRARDLASNLRKLDLRQCRVDLVVRAATSNELDGFGITLYAAGCGPSEDDAYAAWQSVLASAVAATIAAAPHLPHAGE